MILMTAPSGGDASLILAHQLIAAELNVKSGSVFTIPDIGSIINAADLLLGTACTLSGNILPSCPVSQQSNPTLAQQMKNAAATLDNFNSGTLTPSCIPRTPG
jgi:hypothetical protein